MIHVQYYSRSMIKNIVVSLFILLLFICEANGVQLTNENFEAETAGKAAFILFYLTDSKPNVTIRSSWDELSKYFLDSPDIVIGQVDCTRDDDGKRDKLCDYLGIVLYPNMRYGNPWEFKEYKDGRDFESLKGFVLEHVKLRCSPSNMELCNEGERERIEQYLNMDLEGIDLTIGLEMTKLEETEKEFQATLNDINVRHQVLSGEKDDKIKDVKDGDLGYLRTAATIKLYEQKIAEQAKSETETKQKEEEEESGEHKGKEEKVESPESEK